MPMIPYHRIAARLYNRPLMVTAAAAWAASEFLLSRARGVEQQQPRANQFVGESRTPDGGRLPYRVTDDGTAVISIIGELVNRSFGWVDADCGLVSYEFIRHQIATALADPRVLSIVLDIDSPGGEAMGCFALADFIRSAATQKPIVASVNAAALSGGYSIASSALKIVGPKDSEVGSIGVWMLHFDVSEHLEQHGIKPTLIFKGARKVDGHPFGPLTDAASTQFDADMGRIYGMFVDGVQAGRKSLSPAAIRATEARCYFAEEALTVGLIDQIGTFDDALSIVRSMRVNRVVAPPTAATARKANPPAKSSAKVLEEKMEKCGNCGHDRDKHPDDGACQAEGGCGANCQGFTAEEKGEGSGSSAARVPDAATQAEIADLRARVNSEARKRISAEVDAVTRGLLAKDDLRFNVQSVGVIGNMMRVAKAAASGLPTMSVKDGEKEKDLPLNLASVGAFFAEQLDGLTKVASKFPPPAGELPAPDASAMVTAAATGVSLADFAVFAIDSAAAGRINAAVKARRKVDAKFTRNDLFRELGGK